MMVRILKIFLIGLLSYFSISAQASSINTTFMVKAGIRGTCTAIAVPTIDFGWYSGSLISQTANVSVTCSNGTPYNIGFNAGTGSGASVTTRKMTAATSTAVLNYTIKKPDTTNWGNTAGNDTYAGIGTGISQSIVATLQLAAGQSTQSPDIYTDTITVTVNY